MLTICHGFGLSGCGGVGVRKEHNKRSLERAPSHSVPCEGEAAGRNLPRARHDHNYVPREQNCNYYETTISECASLSH